MNPFNKAWIVKAWLLVVIAILGAYWAHDKLLPLYCTGLLAFMCTAVTIGSDRAERGYEAEIKRLRDRNT